MLGAPVSGHPTVHEGLPREDADTHAVADACRLCRPKPRDLSRYHYNMRIRVYIRVIQGIYKGNIGVM